MSETGAGKIERILVALDDTEKAIDLLHTAADLASKLNADLIGLFVEDIDLLRAADLPFFREINLYTRTPRKMSRVHLEQIFQTKVNELRNEAKRILQETRIQWHLEVTRGSVDEEIKKAALDVDLLVMARSTMSDKRLGSTARRLAQALPHRLLLIEPARVTYRNLLTMYDGSEASLRALDTASHLAEAVQSLLTIAVMADSIPAARELQRQAAAWLRKKDIEARFRWILSPESGNLEKILESEGQCMLILPDESLILDKGNITEILNDLTCPVLLIS